MPFATSSTAPAPGGVHGLDVDEQGNGAVTQQRLYQLIRQQGTAIRDRTFEIAILAPGVEAHAFTFGWADRLEQPVEPQRMTGGGTSRSRILRSSVLPSVSRAFRVSSDRRRGSLDQAVPLISTTT